MRKPVKIKIVFEDKECSEKERDYLWGKFFMELAKLKVKQELEKCKIY